MYFQSDGSEQTLCPCVKEKVNGLTLLRICQLAYVLEKIVKEQIQQQIAAMRPLLSLLHGFSAGRPTLTNLLACDSSIANLVNARKSYDIITFDFQRTFDKVPHYLLIEALKEQQLHKTSLKWIASFLSGVKQFHVLPQSRQELCKALCLGPYYSPSLSTPNCYNLISSCQDHRLR